MTISVETPDNELSIPFDYVPGARGHAVLAAGEDESGSAALAVWRLGATGQAVGAWVLSMSAVRRDNEEFQQVMNLIRDRSLVAWDADSPMEVIGRIAPELPASLVESLRRNVLLIPDLLAEIAEQRAAITLAADEYRRTASSKVAPLMWPTDIPSPAELRVVADEMQHPAAPVVAKALGLSAGLARVAQLWQETEQVRARRRYLRTLGDPQLLPPRWLESVRAAVNAGSQV
ncbi:DUF6218 family protein [Micromonospora zhanjiangensis]|uniref:DUF6218 family protein n=1 Tax=Micromonospora zhanjiangensis TaxID=1522057 RepID=A0ABV8KIE5_9ACTN